MISKNKIKQIKSLSRKRGRQKENLFIAEGDKIVKEILTSSIEIADLFATEFFLKNNKTQLSKIKNIHKITPEEIKKASLLKQPQDSLALCRLPSIPSHPIQLKGLSLYLDSIQDPGNLGTIIRICDWFGIEHLFCSPDTADLYNPKVIQSSMGSFCRVNIHYTKFYDLHSLCKTQDTPIYGTFLNGDNIYNKHLPSKALIVLGNEGKGISHEIEKQIKLRITIPSFRTNRQGAESLNVAIATGIICSEFCRSFKVER